MEKISKISIIIPLYNEEKLVSYLLEKVVKVKLPYKKEIIVVNDGSKDNSFNVVKEFIKKHPKHDIQLFDKPNGGKGSALKLGFSKATGDILIIQDADLEYEPRDYNKLFNLIAKGKTKVVYGSRTMKRDAHRGHFSFYLGGLGVTYAFNLVYFTKLTDEPTCYKVYHKDLKELLVNAEGNTFDWEPEVTAKLVRLGHKIFELPINYYPRTKAAGKKINWKDGVIALTTILKWRFKNISHLKKFKA